MRTCVPIMAALLAAAGCGGPPEPGRARIENPVVTLPAVPGRPGAAYFSIRTNRTARLAAVSSPAIGRIELHESTSRGGMSRMGPLRDARLSPAAPMTFAPGGRHAMLFGIAQSVRVGQRVALTFTFDGLPPVSVEADVRGPGDAGH
ncbi:MAG TPA: copper chaperone PCu(A)C [Allosphingosinicella sp.]|nr:copper chaperone PCu(A)C [Allosphingosinicella sp.]